jgi:hypothetical protein
MTADGRRHAGDPRRGGRARSDPAPAEGDVSRRAAWYTPRPGTWRDWLGILHPPYTAWHLAYVLVGAGLAPRLSLGRLGATLLAFALAVGVGAHGLDELKGRPLGTTIPARRLATVSALSIAGAVAIGALGVSRIGWGLIGFMAAGVVLVVAYNLELGGLHNDLTFALAWGAFPLLTAYYAQTGTLRPSALLGGVFAFGLSRAQRVLSTEARELRRRVAVVNGAKLYADGTTRALTREALLGPVESALVTLSWCTCALGVALVVARGGH